MHYLNVSLNFEWYYNYFKPTTQVTVSRQPIQFNIMAYIQFLTSYLMELHNVVYRNL